MMKFSYLQQVLRGCKNIGIRGCQPETGDSVCLDQRPCLRILIFVAGGINLNAAHSVTLKRVGSNCMNSR